MKFMVRIATDNGTKYVGADGPLENDFRRARQYDTFDDAHARVESWRIGSGRGVAEVYPVPGTESQPNLLAIAMAVFGFLLGCCVTWFSMRSYE